MCNSKNNDSEGNITNSEKQNITHCSSVRIQNRKAKLRSGFSLNNFLDGCWCLIIPVIIWIIASIWCIYSPLADNTFFVRSLIFCLVAFIGIVFAFAKSKNENIGTCLFIMVIGLAVICVIGIVCTWITDADRSAQKRYQNYRRSHPTTMFINPLNQDIQEINNDFYNNSYSYYYNKETSV